MIIRRYCLINDYLKLAILTVSLISVVCISERNEMLALIEFITEE